MASLNEKALVGEVTDWDAAVALATAPKYPVAAMAGTNRTTADNSVFSYSVFKMGATPVAGTKDGETTTPANNMQPTQVIQYTEEFRKDWAITRKAAAAKTYTRHNSSAWQKKQALAALQQMKEILYCSRQEMVTGVGTTVAQLTRGLICQLSPASLGLQTTNPISSDFRLPSAQFSNTALNSITADGFMALVGAAAKTFKDKLELTGIVSQTLAQTMSSWAWKALDASGPHAMSIRRNGEKLDVDMDVEVYKFPQATVTNIVDYWLDYDVATGTASDNAGGDGGFFIDPDMLGERVFQPLTHTDVDDNGQGKGGFWAIDCAPVYEVPSKAVLILPGETIPTSGS